MSSNFHPISKMLLVSVMLFATLACNISDRAIRTATPEIPTTQALPVSPPPGSSPSPLHSPSPGLPGETPSDLPAQNPARSPSPSVPVLKDAGPWLIYNTTGGMFAANADGSSPTALDARLAYPAASIAAAPKGGWAAFQVSASTESGGVQPDISLAIAHLPEALVNLITPLLSADIGRQMGGPDRPPEAVVALTVPGNMSWSPDGRYLAFIAAFESASTDLYVFDTQTGRRTRLTDGPTEAASLFWSPDSRWIVHQAVRTFGTGAGWDVEAVWAAAVDGSQVKKLYTTDVYRSGEVFLGWSGPDTFIVYSLDPVAIATQLRQVNIITGQSSNLYARQFNAAAFDPNNRVAAMVVDQTLAELQNLAPAAYVVTGNEQIAPVQEGEWSDLEWSQSAGRFLASGGQGVLAFDSSGEAIHFPDENWATGSPDGQWLSAWGNAEYDPKAGIRIYTLDGDLQAELSSDSVDWLLWRPDALGLTYIYGEDLFYQAWPGGSPQKIATDLQAGRDGGIGWVLK